MLAKLRSVLGQTRGLLCRFFLYLCLLILNMVVAFQMPLAIQDFTGELLGVAAPQTIGRLVMRVALLTAGLYLIKWLIMCLKVEMSTLLARTIRRQVHAKILRFVDIREYRRKGPSYYTQVINFDVSMVSLLVEQIIMICAETAGAVIIAIALFRIQGWLTVVIVCFSPVYWLVLKTMYQKAGQNMHQLFKERVDSSKVTAEVIFGMLDLRVSGGLPWIHEKFVQIQKRYLSFMTKLATYMSVSSSFTEFALTCLQVVIIFIGVQFIRDDAFSLPMLMAFLSMMKRLYQPMLTWCMNSLNMQQGITGLQRIREILALEEEANVWINRDIQRLCLQHVSHGYDKKQLLAKISLEIARGEWVLIYGLSGSGKSTLLEILSGLQKPEQGQVLLNGQALGTIDRECLHQRLAVVTDELYLTGGDVYDNVAYTCAKVDKAAIRKLLEEMKLTRLLENPGDHLKRDGNSLSQGEKQRLALARALYRNPQILLLDEPTSALDYATEGAVMAALKRRRDMTVVMVTHRRNLVTYADRAYDLEEGELREMVGQEVVPGATVGLIAQESM